MTAYVDAGGKDESYALEPLMRQFLLAVALHGRTRKAAGGSWSPGFQDLIEAEIYPLAIYLDDEDVVFNRAFFYETPNHLSDYLPKDKNFSKALRLIMMDDYRSGHTMNLVMDSDTGQAIAFLMGENAETKEST